METPAFQAETHMEHKDYRKFLYIATFFRSPVILPLILLMCGVGAFFASCHLGKGGDPLYLLALWGAISALVITAVCFSVERKNKRREAAARAMGAMDRRLVMSFYEDSFKIENPAREESRQIPYSEFFMLLETKDYYIFYLTKQQITLLCKRDLKPEEVVPFSAFIAHRFGKKYRKVNL